MALWPEARMVGNGSQGMIDDKTRILLIAIRQALLIALGAIEEFLGIERSVVPKRKRG